MESKFTFVSRFEENTNSEVWEILFSIFPSATGASMRVRTLVPLLWLCAGRDEYGSAWYHTGLPFLFLQQPSQPRGHSEWKVWHAAHPQNYFQNIQHDSLESIAIHVFFTKGAMSPMAPPQCSPTCLTNKRYTSMIYHHLKLVRDLKTQTRLVSFN